MKKALVLLLMLPVLTYAQRSEQFIEKGLLSTKGTLGVGIPTGYDGTNMYINANCEYYIEDNVSYRGSLWIFLGTTGTDDVFSKNHTLYTGFFYHVPIRNNLDPYLGIEPGFSWTQYKQPKEGSEETLDLDKADYRESISPLACFTIGANYYATKFMHLFLEAKYNQGIHLAGAPPVSLNEFRIAFGFGFNMKTIRKK